MRPNVVAPVIRSATGRSCCEAEVIVLAAIPSLFHPADAHRIRSSPRLERAGGSLGWDAGTGQWLRAVVPASRCSEKARRRRPLVERTAVACPCGCREFDHAAAVLSTS